MKSLENEEIQETEKVILEEAPPDKESPDKGSLERASPDETVFPEELFFDEYFEEIPVLDIPEAPLELTEDVTPGVVGPVEPNEESISELRADDGFTSKNQHPLDALVKAYNGVGLATNFLAASAISVLITTRHFAATRRTASRVKSTTTEMNVSDTEDGSSATTTTNATIPSATTAMGGEKEDFVIAALSKIACHGILPECHFTFASLQPLNDPLGITEDEYGTEDNSILLDHLDNSILFDPSEKRDLLSSERTRSTKTKVTTAKGKKWRDRVLARKHKQQRQQQQPQKEQEEQEIEQEQETERVSEQAEVQQPKPRPQLHKSFRQPSVGSIGIFTDTVVEGEMVHPSLDNNSEPSEVAPPNIPRCLSSTLKADSVAEEPAPESLSSISSTEEGGNEQEGFAQLVVELSGSVGVCWANYPCGVSVEGTTKDQPDAGDTASFVTAKNLQENLAPENSSVYSFFTAVSGDIDAISDTKYKNSISMANHPRSAMERISDYFHCKWNYESLSTDPSKNAALTTAVMDTTDTAKGSIWEWITGVEPQTSVFSSSLAKEALDSANNDLLLEETIEEVEMYLFGQDGEGGNPKSSKSQQMSPGPMGTTYDNVAESVYIEAILEESLLSPLHNEYSPSKVDVVVFGNDRRSSNDAEPSISNSVYFCCWFDGPSWNSSAKDPSYPSKPDKQISCDASVGSTQASTNISTSSSKVSKASSWFGKHYKQPWYVMPTLNPLSENDGASSYCDGDEQSVSDSKNESDMSRLAILRELHRFQTGLCSDRVMEMVHFPTNDLQPRDENVVVLH